MWFIILFAIVAAVCVITVIVTVLRKKLKVKLININILAPVQSKNKRGEKYNL